MMNQRLQEILKIFAQPKSTLREILYRESSGVKYFGPDSESEGHPDPEKAFMQLYVSAVDVIGSKHTTQDILDELVWMTECSLNFYDQAPSMWLLYQDDHHFHRDYKDYWDLARRLARAALNDAEIKINEPKSSFHSLLEYYDFSFEKE